MPAPALSTNSIRWPLESDRSKAEKLCRAAMADPELRPKLIRKLSTSGADGLLHDWSFWARPSQQPPADSDWVYWMMLAGRGAGKTRAGAEYIRAIKNHTSPIALVGA